MYHLLVAISLIITQKYLGDEQLKKSVESKYESSLKKDFTNKTDGKSKISEVAGNPKAKNKITIAQDVKSNKDIIIFDDKKLGETQDGSVKKIDKDFAINKTNTASSETTQDILENLRKEEEKRNKELKTLVNQDLESLGLDVIDEDFATVKHNDNKKTANSDTSVTKDNLNNKATVLIKEEDTKKSEINSDNLKAELSPTVIIPTKDTAVATDNVMKADNKVLPKNKVDELPILEVKDEVKGKAISLKDADKKAENIKKDEKAEGGVVDNVVESIRSVKDKIAKSFSNDPEGNKKIEKSQDSSYDPAKENEQAEKIVALQLKQKKENDLRQARRDRKKIKLDELRKEYLEEFSQSFAVEDDQGFGVPQKKILPRFIVHSIPDELLDRNKSMKNKHLPNIITPVENINFMFEAIAKNQMDSFRSLYHLVKNPNIKNSKGDTILIFSILTQRYEAVAFLLANGANPNLKNKLGYTPLNVAIEMSDYVAVELLTQMGADINLVDNFGVNYLMQATRVGYFPIVDFLVEKGIDVTKTDNNGFSAIDIAVKSDDQILTKYLTRYGAKKNQDRYYQATDKTLVEGLQNRLE